MLQKYIPGQTHSAHGLIWSGFPAHVIGANTDLGLMARHFLFLYRDPVPHVLVQSLQELQRDHLDSARQVKYKYRIFLNWSSYFLSSSWVYQLSFPFVKWYKSIEIDLPNLRILLRKNNEPTLFILFLAMTVITNTSNRPNVSLVHI